MTSISTLAFNGQTRVALNRLQGELNDLTVQIANDGRYGDVGRTLGRLTGSAVSARSVSDALKEQQTSNAIIDRRLKTGEAAMATMSEGANLLANNLTGVSIGKDWSGFMSQAKSGLAGMASALNTADAGVYVFGGIQSEKQPLAPDYTSSDAKTAADANFKAFVLGATPNNLVSELTDVQMKAYLSKDGYTNANGTFRYGDLFDDAAWKGNWSEASSDRGEARISGSETIRSGLSANDQAFRSVASGYTMLIDLDIANLGEGARTAVLSASSTALRSGTLAITGIGAEVGTTRKRIETANTELQRQEDIMTSTVDALEVEDITVLGQRAANLQTNLNAAYAVTAKIQKLSLLDYL
ncbi:MULTISPECIES: flagellar hook-associated family protein [unclassified Aureimonas]|uniref:flagellar hook-associated family protein n=1 Tax=unclassified Aureimonas TaxID=2615206 RepID=UPI0007000321|nr:MULTISPECIES: flagellar hook-associated family protein [unclassified Aureimonas]KQT66086.1 hypothetical protein ASG62_19945 [Aureimonas sp. Leaf427]KQT81050.1 hypothetical protein ASG54_06305 [Aureimonas sp. Leaf460]